MRKAFGLALLSLVLTAECLPAQTPHTRTYKGRSYVALKDVGSAYRLSYGVTGGQYVLSTSGTVLRFTPRSRQMTYNGTLVWLDGGVDTLQGLPVITKSDFDKNLAPLLRPAAVIPPRGTGVIVLDPGHGGDDTGAIGAGKTQEKIIMLDVAKRVRAKLANQGHKVMLTRDTDRSLDLADRCARARKMGASLFVSLHLNATRDRTVAGIETYALTPAGHSSTAAGSTPVQTAAAGNRHDGANFLLAYSIQRAMRIAGLGTDRGVRRARFAVLKDAPCPAALVECAFLSHPRTETLLQGEWYRDKLAQAVADGILAYHRMAAPGGAGGGAGSSVPPPVTTSGASGTARRSPAVAPPARRAPGSSAIRSERPQPPPPPAIPPRPELPPLSPPLKMPGSGTELIAPPGMRTPDPVAPAGTATNLLTPPPPLRLPDL